MSILRWSFSPRLAALGCAASLAFAGSASALTINPTFTSNFNANFGANAGAAQTAWIAAANVFASNFTDNININITVDAVAGTGVFGQSNTSLFSTSYTNMRNLLVADAKTATDATATGAGGSFGAVDPKAAVTPHTWWVTRAQAKAIGLIADDLSNDGTTTFGAGNNFSFSGTPGAGQFDFKGVAAHEIAEVMGRLGIAGGTIGGNANSFALIDNFSYTAANTKDLGNGGGRNFSIDNGNTLLKLYNNAASNGLDVVDWAPGTNDAFNQFSNSGVVNPVSAADLQVMDAIGYDQISPVPEPATVFAAALGVLGLAYGVRRRMAA